MIMGKVVRFSEFGDYYVGLKNQEGPALGTVLDTNVIIALGRSLEKFHTHILEFFDNQIYSRKIPCFTTVNITSEFLEFHRRLLITKGLQDAINEFSDAKFSNKQKEIIRRYSAKLKKRESDKQAGPTFYDTEIKNIRKIFCNSGKKGLDFWNSLCDVFLRPRLYEEYNNLKELKVKYLSIHEEGQKHFFSHKIEWEGAINICAKSCTGFSDSMILNALQATKFPFVISLDSDIAYAVLSDPFLKDVVMPDDLISKNSELQKLINEQR